MKSMTLTIDIFSEDTEDTTERLSRVNKLRKSGRRVMSLTVVSKKDIGAWKMVWMALKCMFLDTYTDIQPIVAPLIKHEGGGRALVEATYSRKVKSACPRPRPA